jgi:hypothetical protein
MLRPLRIAVSVVSILVCLLAAVAWVRNGWLVGPPSEPAIWGGFIVGADRRGFRFRLPYWFVFVCAASASAFLVKPFVGPLSWQFSVRTLLIAITAVAVVLGIITYATRG